MLSLQNHKTISRDIRKSSEENRAKFLQKMDELERDQLWVGIRNGLIIVLSTVGVLLTVNYFN